jgi:calcium/calmodulin-dependent protein kinase I
MASNGGSGAHTPQPPAQVQPCRYKTGKTLGAGSYSVVKECVHIDTGRYYAAKVINKRLMAGREHMVSHSQQRPSGADARGRSGTRLQC